MSEEIKQIQRQANIDAKVDALTRKVLLIADNDPTQLIKLQEWDEERLQMWIDKALQYECYNLVKALTGEQKRRKNG